MNRRHRRNKILDYLAKHGSIKASNAQARTETGFAHKPVKQYNRLSYHLELLWEEGVISGFKTKGKWEYQLI